VAEGSVTDRAVLRAVPLAWQKLWLYISLARGEVGGLASVISEGDDFLMTDCFLIEQRATDVDTELEPKAASRFLIDYLNQGGDPSQLRLWWHSHARESVFWSMDDERTIERFGGEYLVSLEGNFAGKFLARLDRFEPKREPVGWLDFVPPGSAPALDGPTADLVRLELERCVTFVTRRTNKLWTDGPQPRSLHH
jgi:hypothetical protein